MDQASVTWILTADGAEARVFCERARTGPLKELSALHMAATDDERTAGHRHHGDPRTPQHEPESLSRSVTASREIDARQGKGRAFASV